MEKITKFKAIDGTEFYTENECLDYENLIARVNAIMCNLPVRPNDTDFINGEGFIQHEKSDLITARIAILKICKEYINHKWVQQTMDDETVHPSWVGRLLGDYYGIKPLEDAWDRFYCVDKQFREWGQPYFAANPDEGQQVRL